MELVTGGYCSKHHHIHRANLFAVHSGIVDVEWWDGYKQKVVQLKTGMVFDIPSKIVHRFWVIETGTMTEFYYADNGGLCLPDDIVRLEEGGMDLLQHKTDRIVP